MCLCLPGNEKEEKFMVKEEATNHIPLKSFSLKKYSLISDQKEIERANEKKE